MADDRWRMAVGELTDDSWQLTGGWPMIDGGWPEEEMMYGKMMIGSRRYHQQATFIFLILQEIACNPSPDIPHNPPNLLKSRFGKSR
jgi:hypothetical protein